MCKNCQELDTRIERYRRIIARFDDPQVLAGVARLIEEAERELATVRHEQQSKPVVLRPRTEFQ